MVVENGGVSGELADDPLRVVARELAAGSVARVPGLPLFVGGAVGYVGYETATTFERVPRHDVDVLDVPDFTFMMADVVVAFDHARRVMQVIAPVRPGGAPDLAYDAALKRIDSYLKRIDVGPRGVELGAFGVQRPVPMEAHTTREQFIEQVKRAKEHIVRWRHLPDRALAALLGALRRGRARPLPRACAPSTRRRTCSTCGPAT